MCVGTLALDAGKKRPFSFPATVGGGSEVVNEQCGVTSAEGVSATGLPVITDIIGGGGEIYLPLVLKN
jgi:hypothetical protein